MSDGATVRLPNRCGSQSVFRPASIWPATRNRGAPVMIELPGTTAAIVSRPNTSMMAEKARSPNAAAMS